MRDNGLKRVSLDAYNSEGNLHIEHIYLAGAMLRLAYEWGIDIRASHWRGVPKTHGSCTEYDGYPPIDGKTLYL